MSTTRFEVGLFDGKGDFGSWQKKIKVLLSHHKVVLALEADILKWPVDKLSRKAEIDEEAYNLIFLHLGDSVIRKVDGMNTPLELWGKLESLYSVIAAPNLVYLKGLLFNFKMDGSKTIDENLDEFTKMTLLLRGTDQALGETNEAMILLNSLPDEYQVVKNALQYTGTVPKYDLVVSGIKARELELNSNKRNGNILFARGKPERKGFQDQAGSSGLKDKKKGKKIKPKNSKWKCYHCGKEGHIKKHCYDYIRKQKQEGNASVATDKLATCLAEVLNVSSDLISDEWILDSGCSFHMSPNKIWFRNFNTKELGSVYMGNNHTCKVLGSGDIVLRLKDGKTRVLTNVRYVPGLKRNLISLGTLDELGFCYKAQHGCLNVFKNDELILSSVKRNGLYILNGCCTTDNTDAALVSKSDLNEIWHL